MLTKLTREFIPIDLQEMRPAGFQTRQEEHIRLCMENVSSGNGWRSVSTCPICGSSDRNILFARFGVDIVQCIDCSLGYSTMFPEDANDVYCNEQYLPGQKENYLANADYRKMRFGTERLNIIANHSNRRSPSQMRLLDVGCGTGWFLEMAQESGYQVFGIELGKELASFTAQRLGIKVWSQHLDEIDVREGFDVITMFDVIEHVVEPAKILRGIKRLLSPGGFALVFTPNLDSFAFRVLKENSSLVTPAEHLYYFTFDSFKRLSESVGLEIIGFETKGMDIPDILSYYRDDVKDEQVARFLVSNCTDLQASLDRAGCANHMRFVISPA